MTYSLPLANWREILFSLNILNVMGLQFSPATERDSSALRGITEQIWRKHYSSIISPEQIEYMLNSKYSPKAIAAQMKNGERFFLVSENNILIAYASVEQKAEEYFLHKFYVDIPAHRKGIGRKLFDYLWLQFTEPLPIRLQVNRLNYTAINFYFKIGFVIESVGDFDIGNGYFMRDFVMVRGLIAH